LDICNGLNDGAEVGGVLELGNEDAYSCDYSLDERLWYRLVFAESILTSAFLRQSLRYVVCSRGRWAILTLKATVSEESNI